MGFTISNKFTNKHLIASLTGSPPPKTCPYQTQMETVVIQMNQTYAAVVVSDLSVSIGSAAAGGTSLLLPSAALSWALAAFSPP